MAQAVTAYSVRELRLKGRLVASSPRAGWDPGGALAALAR